MIKQNVCKTLQMRETKTPSTCQKIVYGKTSLHINQFLYCCPLISLWKYSANIINIIVKIIIIKLVVGRVSVGVDLVVVDGLVVVISVNCVGICSSGKQSLPLTSLKDVAHLQTPSCPPFLIKHMWAHLSWLHGEYNEGSSSSCTIWIPKVLMLADL